MEIRPERIAVAVTRDTGRAGISRTAITRFEQGVQWTQLERVIDAYAEELGVDPLDLWAEALELARRDGAG